MITPYNILRHELMGLHITIKKATHSGYLCEGKIVDETKNTLKIKTKSGEKTIPKDCVTMNTVLPDKTVVEIDGNLLSGRPEDRIKKRYRINFI